MSAIASRHRALEAGFTLVEMLVVLAIIALTAVLSVPMLSGGTDTLRLDIASSELVSSLRATRSAAITGNSQIALTIDVDRRVFGSTAAPARSFAADIETRLTFASTVHKTASDGGFLFFADGSSTGGDVTLALHGKQIKVCIDWLTGTVRKAEMC